MSRIRANEIEALRGTLTFHERKALADAAARRLKQRAQEHADPKAQRKWQGSVLSRWMAQRVKA